MYRSAVSWCLAAVVLCSLCSACRCFEHKQPGQTPPPANVDLATLATARSFLSESTRIDTTEHFVILHETGTNYVPGTGRTLEQAHARFYGAFSKAGFELTRSADRLVWICFSQQSKFNAYAVQVEGTDLSWLDGYYSTLTNRVAVVEPSPRVSGYDRAAVERSEPGGGRNSGTGRQGHEEVLPMSTDESQVDIARLTHELAHQLAFNSGLQRRGVMYPFWVSEGLATNFEFEGLSGTGFEKCTTARRDCLVQTHAAGQLVPLAEFVVQTTVPSSVAQSRRYYAQAWAFFQYLLTERSGDLRSYLHQVATLPAGRHEATVLLREFTNVFGSPEAMECSWGTFLDRQVRLARIADTAVWTNGPE